MLVVPFAMMLLCQRLFVAESIAVDKFHWFMEISVQSFSLGIQKKIFQESHRRKQ